MLLGTDVITSKSVQVHGDAKRGRNEGQADPAALPRETLIEQTVDLHQADDIADGSLLRQMAGMFRLPPKIKHHQPKTTERRERIQKVLDYPPKNINTSGKNVDEGFLWYNLRRLFDHNKI